LDLVIGVGHSESTTRSEDRRYVGDDDLPIEQTTVLRRTPIELGVRMFLRDRGRAVSRFAWVPYGWAPYLEAGAGWMVHGFEQTGEFVDYETLEIFRDHFRSEGSTPTAHLAAGVELALGRRLLATG